MTLDWHYRLPRTAAGNTAKKRYKRFLADIELDTGGSDHRPLPQYGPMTGVCHIGGRVMVSRSDNPNRKLPYTWELAEVNDTIPTWVGVKYSSAQPGGEIGARGPTNP